MYKILYGICGIGKGHFYRQKPIIDWLISQNYEIVIFAYGDSLKLANLHYKKKVLSICEVCVPYYIGNLNGLDFEAISSINKNIPLELNFEAFKACSSAMGRPDLVITDYEPNSAQYGYAHNTQILSIDQQSKFFSNNVLSQINGFNSKDELMRLRMFFPKATRIACSFFNVDSNEDVKIVGPIIRDNIRNLNTLPDKDSYLVYLSAQNLKFKQFENIFDVLSMIDKTFYLFGDAMLDHAYRNIIKMPSDDDLYLSMLSKVNGIISTAGHSLLSESMCLNIPVLACPLNLYEQQLNAHMIQINNLGLSTNEISKDIVLKFINSVDDYRINIKESKALNHTDGLITIKKIIKHALESCF